MESLISVIVPVYGVEKYLRQCVESVLAQTFTRWELILVDDGSPDGSPEICDHFASIDTRITVIHQPNRGVSAARNVGIEVAQGDYITFLDGDDSFDDSYLQRMYSAVVDTGCSVACCDFFEYNDGEEIVKKREKSVRVYRAEEFVRDILYQRLCNNSVWAKLYSRDVIGELRFNKDIRYEDLDLFYRFLLRTEKIAYLPMSLYNYRQSESSYMHRFTLQRADVLDVTDRMAAWIGANKPELLPAALDRRMSAHFNIYGLMAANGVRNKELEDRCWHMIRAQRRASLFDPRVRLKNKLGALLSFLGPRALRTVSSVIYKK